MSLLHKRAKNLGRLVRKKTFFPLKKEFTKINKCRGIYILYKFIRLDRHVLGKNIKLVGIRKPAIKHHKHLKFWRFEGKL